MSAPQQLQTPAPNAVPENETLLASVMDATLSREMNELVYTREISQYMASSGYFADASRTSQAAVKIMLGRDLGLSPSVAMMSIHIGKSGRPSLSGALHAAMLKRAGYSWRFVKHDRTECTAAFYYKGEPLLDEAGKRVTVSFTYDDAKTALLTEPSEKGHPSMYTKYGADMLFNRMIVRFERRFAPEVTAGMTCYTPDELEEIEAKDVEREITAKYGPDFREAKKSIDRRISEAAELRGQEPAKSGQENPALEAASNESPAADQRMAQPEPPAPPLFTQDRPPMPEVRTSRALTMPTRGTK